MTVEEKVKFEKMEITVDTIQRDVTTIKQALIGNEISGEKGLIGQLNTIKAEQELLKAEVKSLSEERVKNTVYVKIITWLLAVVGVGVISLIINYFK